MNEFLCDFSIKYYKKDEMKHNVASGQKRETFKIINRHCASYESLLWTSASNFYI